MNIFGLHPVVVFGTPEQQQRFLPPLIAGAKRWMELEAANLMMLKAACLYDRGKSCGDESNAAKYLGAEAGFRAS